MSFRLLMEYHSFLFKDLKTETKLAITGFPSPYGVIFILTCYITPNLCQLCSS